MHTKKLVRIINVVSIQRQIDCVVNFYESNKIFLVGGGLGKFCI